MRHGPAEDESADGLDGSRALTLPGRERVRLVAKKLEALGEAPKLIVSSPLVRALQTAEIVHQTLSVEAPVEANGALAPRGHAAEMVLAAARANKKRMMVVGHEPDLSLLCARLLGESLPHGLMKAMVIGIRITQEGAATLRFVLEPKLLDLMTDQRAPSA
ncbi:MAG: SixA phosphatase family protein [Polyangiales bacterium]